MSFKQKNVRVVMGGSRWWVGVGLWVSSGLVACSHGPKRGLSEIPGDVQVWTQHAGKGQLLAKALTLDEGDCPKINLTLAGKSGSQPGQAVSFPMEVRSALDSAFPQVCQFLVPANAVAANIEGRSLNLNRAPKRIAVMGDTGCRVKVGDKDGNFIQDCADPQAWPFQQIAESVAQFNPDLTIHVGDYLYRESYSQGDHWNTWKDDFFAPAARLMAVAPWIFVRGNHESCHRAWQGWFRMLEPGAVPASCPKETQPYLVNLASLRLGVVDLSEVADYPYDPVMESVLRKQFYQVFHFNPTPDWILSHKPIWYGAFLKERPKRWVGETFFQAFTHAAQVKASDNLLNVNWPDSLSLIVSGHYHLFQLLALSPDAPLQVVTGNGGTQLSRQFESLKVGKWIKNWKIRASSTFEQFGFVTFEKLEGPGHWEMVEHDVQGHALKVCQINEKELDCGSDL